MCQFDKDSVVVGEVSSVASASTSANESSARASHDVIYALRLRRGKGMVFRMFEIVRMPCGLRHMRRDYILEATIENVHVVASRRFRTTVQIADDKRGDVFIVFIVALAQYHRFVELIFSDTIHVMRFGIEATACSGMHVRDSNTAYRSVHSTE